MGDDNKKVDVCIIGSGAGGAPLAKELSRAGLSVVILEKGRFYKTEDFLADELKIVTRNFFFSNIKDEPRTFRSNENEKAVVIPPSIAPLCVGGGTVTYGAISPRLKRENFKMRSIFGSIQGASIEDWPISYEDLEPFYEKSEYEIGISGLAGANPFEAPRKKPYPLPPLKETTGSRLIENGCRKLGYHPYPVPRAIISKDYNGRPGCMYCGFCLGYGCTIGSKSSVLVTLLPKALGTGRCKIIPESMAKEIKVEKNGKIKSVVYFDSLGREREQLCRIVCVCCGAIESARLLLNSKSNLFPNGLANDRGLVGKNLTLHIFLGASGLFKDEVEERAGMPPIEAIDDFYFTDPKLNFVNGGIISMANTAGPITVAKGIRIWGTEFKKEMKKVFNHGVGLVLFGEDLPRESNSVTIASNVKDKYGIPVAEITHSYHEIDKRMSKYIVKKAMEILEAAGAYKTELIWLGNPVFNYHQMGTCRFGNDPKKSVLNKFCQSHDVKNLFVVDGSFMPTSGGVNPTLTIQANSFRVAKYIIEEARKGNI